MLLASIYSIKKPRPVEDKNLTETDSHNSNFRYDKIVFIDELLNYSKIFCLKYYVQNN